jgi:hypothetical protein
VSKEKVALFGASGTMGFLAFKELWKRRDRCDIVVLLYSAEKNRSFVPQFFGRISRAQEAYG